MPFSFDYGLNQLLTSVLQRATLVLQRSAMPADVCRALTRHRITGMAGVPSFWIRLMDGRSPFPALSFSDLRYITNTGGAMPEDLVERYRAHLPGTRIYLMYGLTEAFRSTYLPPEELRNRPGSMGKAIPECDVFAVTEDGRRCRPGEVGELVHRGPTVAQGYWNDPEATERVFRPDPSSGTGDRAVYSGDLVRQDADGFFYFVGRRDELIKSQGVRISPGEVEALARSSGLVSDAVAKGEPDPEAGAVVILHCIPRPDFDEAALKQFFRREAPPYMLPRKVLLHDRFPHLSNGKIDRKRIGS